MPAEGRSEPCGAFGAGVHGRAKSSRDWTSHGLPRKNRTRSHSKTIRGENSDPILRADNLSERIVCDYEIAYGCFKPSDGEPPV